jgi:hypothetical protein
MTISRIFSLFTALIQSLLRHQEPQELKEILLKKLSIEAKNLPYLVIGIFLFVLVFSIALFSLIFGTVTYFQTEQFSYYLNSWVVTSFILFSIAAIVLLPIVNYIKVKSKEIETIKSLKKPFNSILLQSLRPLLTELRREQQELLNAWAKPDKDIITKSKKVY